MGSVSEVERVALAGVSGFNDVEACALNVPDAVGLNGFGGLSYTPFNVLSGLTVDRPGDVVAKRPPSRVLAL